jgi:glutamate-1-semialdehyde 2,1-aminomutase
VSVHSADTTAALEEYRHRTPNSRRLYERAVQSLPGGNTRTTIFFEPYPFYFDRGDGCLITDVDGQVRIDFINNFTSLIVGHSHPRVVAAVQHQVARGFSVASPTELEVHLAEMIRQRLPSVEQIRFTNSGTEATMMAIRAARAHTGRSLLAKFVGSYHGTHDYAAVDGVALAGDGSAPRDGIPAAVADTIVMLPYNDIAGVERIVAQHANTIAAIIVEPVLGSGGVVPAEPAFLQALRELSRAHGIVLIFDEIIAFRIGYHGAQGHYGVQPDLTTLGKIIGGGMPIGAFGGSAELMSYFDPRSPRALSHGGTFNANPISAAAGIATLDELTPAAFERLNGLAADLRRKLVELFEELNVPAQVQQIGSVFNIHFTDQPIRDYYGVMAGDRALQRDLFLATLNHGVVFTRRGMGSLSTPMTMREVDLFVGAIRSGLADLGVA